MEYLLELLATHIENEGVRQIIFISLTGVASFLFIAGILFLGSSLTNPLRRRLNRLMLAGHVDENLHLRRQEKLSRALSPAEKYILPKSEKERSAVETKLVHAGLRDPNALTTYYAVKTLLSICLPLLALIATRFYPELSAVQIVFFIMLAAGIGVVIPNIYLEHKVNERQRRLRIAFPDALDLLVVCVESGLGLVSAIQRVSRDLDVSHPELAEELSLVNTETRLGVPRVDALRNLADRTGLEEIHSLVVLLDQSARFGTSVAEALRVYSEEFRDRRMQAAEESAAKISTKLIFPLVCCLWPGFFVIAVGPAVMRVIEAFKHF